MTEPTRPLIVGTGIAGLWAAWSLASRGTPVRLLTKGALGDSATAWAQGGIAVAIAPGDSPAAHAVDTLRAGGGLSDPRAVEVLTREGPDRVRELLALGARFDRGADGQLHFGLEAAHDRPRIIHAEGDATGMELVRALSAVVQLHPDIDLLEHHEVRRMALHEGRVAGLVVLNPSGRAVGVPSDVIILATGGVGQLYAVTTNPPSATGDGWALALQAGAELRDLEFLQFHPTALKLPGIDPAPLISEAVRGEGALLVDSHGVRFADAADPRGELAPRDIVARAVAEADAAGGAFLDVRPVADFATHFPGIARMLARYGLDPTRDLLPVAPALHYAMGGIVTDLEGHSSCPGIWAAGECASTGVHGANRLASNSLLEGLVFADRVARSVEQTVRPAFSTRPVLLRAADDDTGADETCADVRQALRHAMTAGVGVTRTERSIRDTERLLHELEHRAPETAWRTRNQLAIAMQIARAARTRRESRGSHRRSDFPPQPDPRPESAA